MVKNMVGVWTRAQPEKMVRPIQGKLPPVPTGDCAKTFHEAGSVSDALQVFLWVF